MAVTRFGINMSGFENITFNITIPTDAGEILNAIPETANNMTNGYLAYGILFGILFMMFWLLSDKTAFGNFGYDDARALNLALGTCAVLGISLLEINFIHSLRAVGIFVSLFLITYLYLLMYENRE